MNNSRFHKSIQDIHDVNLTSLEKKAMVQRVLGVHTAPVVSPWTLYSWGNWFQTHRIAAVVAGILIVAVSGNTIVLAAHESLPGDTLYPLKINVTEPIRVAVASGSTDKALVQTALVQARFEEAEVLAARGQLDDIKEKELTKLIDKHVADISRTVAQVAEDRPDMADEVNIAVQASMNAHAKILSTLGSDKAEWPLQSSRTSRIADKARVDAEKFEIVRTVAVTASESTQDDEPAALMMSVQAPVSVDESASSPDISTTSLRTKNAAPRVEEATSRRAVSTDRDEQSSPRSSSVRDIRDDDDAERQNDQRPSRTDEEYREINIKKQQKEQEIYVKARAKIDKELKKEDKKQEIRSSNNTERISDDDTSKRGARRERDED